MDSVTLHSSPSSATATPTSLEALTRPYKAPQSLARTVAVTVADELSPEAKQLIAKQQYAALVANGYRPRTPAGRATSATPIVAAFTLDVSELDGLLVLA